MKYEWKKQAKQFYLPKGEPAKIEVPKFKLFMLDGRGNPNGDAFAEAVQALYSLSYAVKMLPKSGAIPEGYFDYTVFPLEGVWDLDEEGRKLDKLDKERLVYTLMIRQPDFVTEELAQKVIEQTKKKKPNTTLNAVRFGEVEEGLCVQMLHTGSYDSEPESFAKMEEYCLKNNLRRKYKTHREIYISDARKTTADKLKTVLRFGVENVG